MGFIDIVGPWQAFVTLRKKCANTEFFLSVFSSMWTKCGETQSISPYPNRMEENMDTKKLRIWTLFTQCNGDFLKKWWTNFSFKILASSRTFDRSLISLQIYLEEYARIFLKFQKSCLNTKLIIGDN